MEGPESKWHSRPRRAGDPRRYCHVDQTFRVRRYRDHRRHRLLSFHRSCGGKLLGCRSDAGRFGAIGKPRWRRPGGGQQREWCHRDNLVCQMG